MKTIVAGSRDIDNYQFVKGALNNTTWTITKVISGGAMGVDKFGEIWAKSKNIPLEICPADWSTYGKSAGYKRNVEMAKKAEALVAIWDGKSKGTKHMIDIANNHNLVTYIVYYDDTRTSVWPFHPISFT